MKNDFQASILSPRLFVHIPLIHLVRVYGFKFLGGLEYSFKFLCVLLNQLLTLCIESSCSFNLDSALHYGFSIVVWSTKQNHG